MKWRNQLAICVAAAALAVGCSSTGSVTPATSQPTAHGAEAPIGSVPWSQVGPGWLLATSSPAADTAPTTLYLVDPVGGRYPITTFPSSSGVAPELVDWSGDGSRALLCTGDATAVVVDLHTGKQTTTTVNGSPRFTRPDGKAILVSSGGRGNGAATLKRVDWPAGRN